MGAQMDVFLKQGYLNEHEELTTAYRQEVTKTVNKLLLMAWAWAGTWVQHTQHYRSHFIH